MMSLWRLIMYNLLLKKLKVFDVWVVVLMAILFIEHNMRQLHMFQKVESGGGPIFKVVLEC